MPIYEYRCRSCGEDFETLVRAGSTPACPTCAGVDLERRLSLPAIKSDSTHGAAMRAAKARDTKQAREKNAAQRDYELKHHND
ncbi:MAG TPA: zinc ribbon domain-containing protein [Vicinamibacterales bacterium]|nr:zinc ribbon domain-containing protein [Vicinamibacterales bacterium]